MIRKRDADVNASTGYHTTIPRWCSRRKISTTPSQVEPSTSRSFSTKRAPPPPPPPVSSLASPPYPYDPPPILHGGTPPPKKKKSVQPPRPHLEHRGDPLPLASLDACRHGRAPREHVRARPALSAALRRRSPRCFPLLHLPTTAIAVSNPLLHAVAVLDDAATTASSSMRRSGSQRSAARILGGWAGRREGGLAGGRRRGGHGWPWPWGAHRAQQSQRFLGLARPKSVENRMPGHRVRIRGARALLTCCCLP